MTNPNLYKFASQAARWIKWPQNMPQWGIPVLSSWQQSRDFPAPKAQSFRDLWKNGLQSEAAPTRPEPVNRTEISTPETAKLEVPVEAREAADD
jgi:hypothetical protein